MDVILHFDGLRPGTHTWFNNCRGAQVEIRPGNWVIIDTIANPFWENWIERGEAHQEQTIPDGVDFLHENCDPARPVITPPWGDGEPPRGSFSLYGPISDPESIIMSSGKSRTVLDIGVKAIELIRRRYMPVELPGIGLIDARRDKRGGRPVHTLPPPFELNFFVLVRLAWLRCRKQVEAEIRKNLDDWADYQRYVKAMDMPEDPVRRPGRGEVRRRIEDATAKVLFGWGVLRSERMPNRVTIHRDMKASMLTVEGLDFLILRHWKEIVEDESVGPIAPRKRSSRKPNKIG